MLRALPNDTRIYCGHEYTASNVKFVALGIEPDNPALRACRGSGKAAGREPADHPDPDTRREEANTFLAQDGARRRWAALGMTGKESGRRVR